MRINLVVPLKLILNLIDGIITGGGRYFMVPSGELLIEGATLNDTTSTFQCRTVNRLTGETLESETLARVKLQGTYNNFIYK